MKLIRIVLLVLLSALAVASSAFAQANPKLVRTTSLGSLEVMLFPISASWDTAQLVPNGAAFRRAYGSGWSPFAPTTPQELNVVSNLLKQAAFAGELPDGVQVSLGLWQIVTATTNLASGAVSFNEPSGGWVALSPADIEISPLQRRLAAPFFNRAIPFDANNGRKSRGWRFPSSWTQGLIELSNLALDSVWPGTSSKIPTLVSNVVSLAVKQPDRGDEDWGTLYVDNGKRGEFRGNDSKVSAVCKGGVLLARISPKVAGPLPPHPVVTINGIRRPLVDGETIPRVVNGRPSTISWSWSNGGRMGYLALWTSKGQVYHDDVKVVPEIDLRTLEPGQSFELAYRNISSAPDPFARLRFNTR